MLSPQKEAALQRRMEQLGIREEDLQEKFIRGSGHGGQKINKTSSCVYLKHLPSGTEVKCQPSRSRVMNRYLARCELCDTIEKHHHRARLAKKQAREKIRRQKRRRSRAQRRRDVSLKRRHGQRKALRKRPGPDD